MAMAPPPGAPVILSLVFWFWMWGVPGAILAVPMLAILGFGANEARSPVHHHAAFWLTSVTESLIMLPPNTGRSKQ
jgi:hypothetical protein